MTRRRTYSRLARIRIFNRADGICGICGCKIQVGEAWQADHTTPLALGGKDEEANMRPVHERCHREKTAEDVGMIRKADRQRAAHIGTKNKPKRKIPYQLFDGTPVDPNRKVG